MVCARVFYAPGADPIPQQAVINHQGAGQTECDQE
jgi:hypothetical protein